MSDPRTPPDGWAHDGDDGAWTLRRCGVGVGYVAPRARGWLWVKWYYHAAPKIVLSDPFQERSGRSGTAADLPAARMRVEASRREVRDG